MGGTCVLRGCVPKKLLMYAAQFGDALHEARGYGWQLPGEPRFDMPTWAAAKAAETARLEGVYRQMLANSGVQLVEGWAELDAPRTVGSDGPHTVRVGDRRLTARHVLLAAGSAPVRDSIPGIDACATSDDLLDLTTLPDRCAVIGGGFIAVEFASMLVRLGVAVDLYYRDTPALARLRQPVAQCCGQRAAGRRRGAAPGHGAVAGAAHRRRDTLHAAPARWATRPACPGCSTPPAGGRIPPAWGPPWPAWWMPVAQCRWTRRTTPRCRACTPSAT